MVGENSAEVRAKANAYAAKKAAQLRLQKQSKKTGNPIVKVNTRKENQNRADANGNTGFGAGTSAGSQTTPDERILGAFDYAPGSVLNNSFNEKNGGIQNPKFIYPGGYQRDAVNNVVTEVQRGYIRRLTEFYEKENRKIIATNDWAKGTPSTIKNMKCNFQFNPDNITRMVTAESDMQFFFNQDPSQLAQPIPGKAGFSFELLFNREAEVATKKYIDGSGKLQDLQQKDEVTNVVDYLEPKNVYDPSWVAQIGVLADILVLDDVIGQGLAKDIYNAIKSGQTDSKGNVWGFDTENSPNSPTNPTEEDNTVISKSRYDAYATNIGNKAFLTPTPVRVLFTKWMMVEGFVQSVQVTFNKFSKNMIPTQATVMIQMQALYIGFAQQNTFLTQLPNLAVGDTEVVPNTTPSADSPSYDRYKEYDDLLKGKDFFNKTFSINHVPRNGKFVYTQIPPGYTEPEQPAVLFKDLFSISEATKMFWISEETRIGKNGEDWINKWKKEQGKNFKFYWDGALKIYWDSHVVNMDGSPKSRGTFVGPATGPFKYAPGAPPKQSDTEFTQYGTVTNPWVFKVEGQEATAETGYQAGPFNFDIMHTNKGGPNTNRWFITKGEGTDWTFDTSGREDITGQQMLKPFNQDKFTVELGIRWRIEDEVYPDQPIFLYDWHNKKQTFEVHNTFMDNNEWFIAWNNGSYRDVTAAGKQITGTGVDFFKSVGM